MKLKNVSHQYNKNTTKDLMHIILVTRHTKRLKIILFFVNIFCLLPGGLVPACIILQPLPPNVRYTELLQFLYYYFNGCVLKLILTNFMLNIMWLLNLKKKNIILPEVISKNYLIKNL